MGASTSTQSDAVENAVPNTMQSSVSAAKNTVTNKVEIVKKSRANAEYLQMKADLLQLAEIFIGPKKDVRDLENVIRVFLPPEEAYANDSSPH